jgi:hypothetical protein
LATGNLPGGGRARNGARLAPLAPSADKRNALKSGGAKTSTGRSRKGTTGSLVGSMQMDKFNAGNSQESINSGTNKINIVAKKRPPAMNIGFNQYGVDPKR